MKKILLGIFLIGTMLLSSCSTTKVGWVGTNIGNTYRASYQRFDGREADRIRLRSNEPFSLDYEVEVEDGALTLQILAPGGDIVWEETFLVDAEDIFEFTPESSGRYTIRIEGDQTQGRFELNWDVDN